ncbi:MAG: hypothetical protein KKD74_04595 [Bacteroidetes bacterium]|nr:hypothetical protein [Bacteroidota bacterium]
MMQRILMLAVIVLIGTSCGNNHKQALQLNVKGLEPETVVIRDYGEALFRCDTNELSAGLKKIQPDFLPFLDADLDDSANIARIRAFVTDTQLIRLNQACRQVFADPLAINSQLTDAYRRYHHYFPENMIPAVYYYVSGVQFESPVMCSENAAVVALDCYLGTDFVYYQQLGIPRYMIARMTPDHLVNDLMASLYDLDVASASNNRTVLDEMIRTGKKLYFLEAMQPDLADEFIIGYSAEQLGWVKDNEAELWAFMVGESALYSSDFLLFKKLFNDGPFSQDFSPEAPARLGEWVGWQIVRKYAARHPQTSLAELMALTDSQEMLSQSRYKPRN